VLRGFDLWFLRVALLERLLRILSEPLVWEWEASRLADV
jgi:hypothetical protein